MRVWRLILGLAALGAAVAALVAHEGDAPVEWVAPILLFDVGVAVILATLVRLDDGDEEHRPAEP